MAQLDPNASFEALKERVLEGIKKQFPIDGRQHRLELEGIEVRDNLKPDDIRSQYKAKVEGQTWAAPIYAKLSLKDKETGKVVDSRNVRVAELPKITKRYSYIVDGQEYQVDHQWQLKPGAYTRRRLSGELETRFQTANKPSFDITFDAASKQFKMEYGSGKAKIPLYPIMQAMGVGDADLEKTWGKEILEANKKARNVSSAVDQFYRTTRRKSPASAAESYKHLKDTFNESKLRPDATEITLGKPVESVTGEALTLATKKMLDVQAGKPEDDRDSLVFKDLRGVGDYAYDKIMGNTYNIKSKAARRINNTTNVRDIIKFDSINRPIREAFTKNQAAQFAKQINPVEMISSAHQTTIMGEGGVKSERQIMEEVKAINPSHLGFIDPIATPEGPRTGVTLRIPLGARVDSKEPKTPLFNLKTGQVEYVGPKKFLDSKIVLPDQVEWVNGKPKPISSSVKIADIGNEVSETKFSNADYVMRHPSQIFNPTSNLIPFLNNNSGGRATMASRHIEQAISLADRTEPLVQVATPSARQGVSTFEELLGRHAAAHTSPVDGVVKEVKKDAIVVEDKSGKTHEVQIYKNYPLNDEKSVLTSTPLVKPGTKVKSGEVLADTNFSKNGKLALGRDLRIAYMPYKGLNYEDAWVVSESAAQKMSSEHMYKRNIVAGDDTIVGKRPFMAQQHGAFTKVQLENVNDDGVIRIGTKVNPGDPLVLALQKTPIQKRTGLAAIRKSLGRQHANKALTWEGETAGEVVGVHRKGGEVVVHVKTIEPLQVGDKLSSRAANKGVVSAILPDGEMPKDKVGNHVELLMNPCYDDQTEFLTKRGWVLGKDLLDADVFATVNKDSLLLEYQRPIKGVYKWPYRGRMYYLRNKQLDLCVTPNHRMFVAKRVPSALGTLNFNNYRPGTFTLEEARDVFGAPRRYLKAAKWKGERPRKIIIPAGTQKETGPKQKKAVFNTMDFADFMGWYIAEGYVHKKKGGNYVISICQSKSANPEKYDYIKELIERMGFKCVESKGMELQFSHKGLYEFLAKLGKAHEKYVPENIHNLSPDYLSAFLDSYLAGDGNMQYRPESGRCFTKRFTTASIELANDIQLIAFKLGLSVNIRKAVGKNSSKRDIYDCSISESCKAPWVNWSKETKTSQIEKWIDYDGVVYCTEVPNGTLVVRRNGKVVISGNTGVGGRMNVGQLLETAASKIALKTGKPYVVDNFSKVDVLEKVKKDLKQHGISDTEDLFDPGTKQPLGKVLTGNMHMLKLHHQVDKKISVRSGLNLPGHTPETYNINLQPSGGGEEGGQSIDALTLYALLARGAKANIRETQTWKSEGPDPNTDPSKRWASQHHAVWDAIQHGDPLPPPRPTFAFHKFTSMLKAAGVNIDKKGHEFILSPLTDKQIKDLAGDRVLPNPSELVYAKIDPKTGEPRPKKGGLFDEKLTGGLGGVKWSRIDLAEPIPNPIFETSIRSLLDLNGNDFNAIVGGEKSIDSKGKVVELGKGSTGGSAIKSMLDKIDVSKELDKAKKELDSAPMSKVDKILKKVKRLEMLKATGMKPSEAYVLSSLPVLPPAMRPISLLPDGNLRVTDINQLYANFSEVNSQLKDPTLRAGLTEDAKKDLRKNLYDGVRALTGVGVPYADAEHKGLLHQISGSSPKKGYFQSTLIKRKQDMSMRAVITPEPALGLDEIGLPKEHALKLYSPFVVNQLKSAGIAANVLEAQNMVAKGTTQAYRALEKVVEDRPVIAKRDPVLHKYSVQAFKPKLVEGHTIKVHPLVTGGFGADFDGDQFSVFVPISEEAKRESIKMMPSNNLFSEAHGRLMYQPTLESALGLYKLSRVNEETKTKSFKTYADAIEASRAGKLQVTDPIKVGGKKTTVGRVLIATTLPEPVQNKVLTDFKMKLDRDGLNTLLTDIAKNHKDDFGASVNKLKDVGNGASFGVVTLEHSGYVGPERLDPNKGIHIPVGAHTLSLDDVAPDKETRDRIIKETAVQAKAIEGKAISKASKDRQLINLWSEADDRIRKEHLQKAGKNPTNLLVMAQAKTKPSWDQYKQITLAPMLVEDALGRTIPKPITRSYSEGLDLGGYWQQMSGARRGAIMKVQEVQEPGYLTKLLNATTMDTLVTGSDCGAKHGVSLSVTDDSVNDRYLAQPFASKKLKLPEGTLLSPDVVSKIRAADKKANIVVRSALRCEHEKGVCQKCAGLASSGQDHPIGENLGILSAQTLGERAVQLTLKKFHGGGVVGNKGLLGGFARFEQLTQMPENIPNAATLASRAGKVQKIEPDPTGARIWIDGKSHHVGKDADGNPLWKTTAGKFNGWQPPRVGMIINKGESLSDPVRTVKNPHDLYSATGSIEKVQDFLTDEMHKLYEGEGIKRKHVEVLVKSMTNLTQIHDPAGQSGVLKGELHPQSRIAAINRELVKNGKPPILHKPVLARGGVTMLPRTLHEDWMAKMQHDRLRQTVMDAAAVMGRSNIHGLHPVPGLAYGAEFGLTSDDSKRKPHLKHLEDVPTYSY